MLMLFPVVGIWRSSEKKLFLYGCICFLHLRVSINSYGDCGGIFLSLLRVLRKHNLLYNLVLFDSLLHERLSEEVPLTNHSWRIAICKLIAGDLLGSLR